MAAATSPIEPVAEGVRVALKVTPKAARAGVTGVATDAAGHAVLKVRVTAPPEGGKANAALLKLLARTWRLPESSLSLAAGKTGRTKTVLIAGDPDELRVRLGAWWGKLEARK